MEVVEVLVLGGKATTGPPMGPSLGPLGVNIKEIVERVNEKTKEFDGVQVPVRIIVDEKKNFEIEVGTPPTSALIMQELKIEKGSEEPGTKDVGDIPLEKIIKIARMKKDEILTLSEENAVKQVIGTCVSMGVLVDGKKPRDVQKEIEEGKVKLSNS
jgi:large subunit ribosomal protein L11